MKITLTKHHDGDEPEVYAGDPEQIRIALITKYTWLPSDEPLESILEELDARQGFSVDIDQAQPMQKAEVTLKGNFYPDKDEPAFEAVRWLTRGAALSDEAKHRALWTEDADPVRAALLAYDQAITDESVQTVKSWMALAERTPSGQVQEEVQPRMVQPALPADGEAAANMVRGAFEDHAVFTVALGGKHSAGSMLAKDPESGKTLLLKPGSNGQSAAAGAAEDVSTQSQREAAFWHVAKDWDLGHHAPRADLLQVGEELVACIEMLQKPFMLLEDVSEDSAGLARLFLKDYLSGGTIHRWGALDFVLGNPDRHARNMMVNPDGVIKLIDHGSAFAGRAFDPARDRNSFVPFYLRAWAPDRFNAAPLEQKVRWMPRLGRADESSLRGWLDERSGERLRSVLTRYGVAAQVCVERLDRLRALLGQMPADMAVNAVWVGD